MPRRRLGGTGDPVHEHLNYKPSFAFGVPTSFVEPWSVEHYNGRAKDIHGNPVGEEYDEGHFTGKAIDPSDPPVYEARASYLLRHALFIDGERERLGRCVRPGDGHPLRRRMTKASRRSSDSSSIWPGGLG